METVVDEKIDKYQLTLQCWNIVRAIICTNIEPTLGQNLEFAHHGSCWSVSQGAVVKRPVIFINIWAGHAGRDKFYDGVARRPCVRDPEGVCWKRLRDAHLDQSHKTRSVVLKISSDLDQSFWKYRPCAIATPVFVEVGKLWQVSQKSPFCVYV